MKIAQDLDSKLKSVVSVSSESVSKENDGKLIHVAGPISDVSAITLEDEAFAVSVKGSVKLKRLVEMLHVQIMQTKRRKKVSYYKIPKIRRDFPMYRYGVISTSTLSLFASSVLSQSTLFARA